MTMDLLTPQHRWPIWLLAADVPCGLVFTSILYYPMLLRSGTLDPYADSIAIPMFQDLILAAVSAPFVIALTWISLRNYNGRSRLLGWNSKMPFRSWATFVFVAVIAAERLYQSFVSLFSETWWCEIIWLPYSILFVAWLLALRAAALSTASESTTALT